MIIKKILKILGIFCIIFVVGIIAMGMRIIDQNINYHKYTKTNRDLEKKYTAMGSEEVLYKEYDAKDNVIKKYAIWYPKKLEQENKKYPVVIFANGTGGKSNSLKSFLTHLASWGFIAVGNDDENTRTGESLNKTIDFLIKENNTVGSPFYQKIDINNIGIGGHSQGGPAVFNMAGKYPNKNKIKAVYAVSPTSSYHTNIFKDGWEYDLTLVNAPTFMTAGTGFFDAGTAQSKEAKHDEKAGILQGITPLWSLEENFKTLTNKVDKVYARKKDVDHGDSHLQMDGYMTAWFRYYLMNDNEAAKVFYGKNPEILNNNGYQDVKIYKAR